MTKPTRDHKEAKMVAFRDITEDLQRERVRLGISAWDEFAPVNYVLHENDICTFLGIPLPDFRVFNGGRNKKK